MLIEEQVDDKQRGINDYVESSEGEHIGDLAPKSPRKALERVDAESRTLEESYGERAQKYTCDGHYESRYKVIGLSDLRHYRSPFFGSTEVDDTSAQGAFARRSIFI